MALGHSDIKAYLRQGKKFDIVVVNAILISEGGYYLAKKFGASLALYFTGQVSLPWMDAALGQPHNPSYLPNALLDVGTDMNFIHRIQNFVMTYLIHFGARDYYILGKANELLDKHFPGDERPNLLDLERNASVAFGFGHPLIMDGWRPTNPNYVNLGMMNCRYIELKYT